MGIDKALAELEAHEASRAKRIDAPASASDVHTAVLKGIERGLLKAERQHRLATSDAEIRVYEC